MLSYGCTRIEIGVQSIYEDVAKDTNRAHTVAAVCNSFQLAKDCGFKVSIDFSRIETILFGWGELILSLPFRFLISFLLFFSFRFFSFRLSLI
jgi:hypothetical protein